MKIPSSNTSCDKCKISDICQASECTGNCNICKSRCCACNADCDKCHRDCENRH